MIQLHDYFRSSASFRVRIVLHLKRIPFHAIPVHLLRDGGEHNSESYRNKNPQSLVPMLEDNGFTLTQSLAIIDYLEQRFPDPSIYPSDVHARQQALSFALHIACDIHPLNNLRVLRYLKTECHLSEEQQNAWYQHWIKTGLTALESILSTHPTSLYCFGNEVSIADVCLIPQLYNARRFQCDVSSYPIIQRIEAQCKVHPAFLNAWPTEEGSLA